MRRRLAIALLVTMAGCARVGAPPAGPVGTGAVSRAASLAGLATLGGQRLRVVIRLETDVRGRGVAHLEIPELGLTAEGSALWWEDRLELDLRYEGSCPGELRIRARRTGDGTPVEGTISGKDCTGEESGSVVLEVTTGPGRVPGRGARVERMGGEA